MSALIVPRGVVTDSFIDYVTTQLVSNDVAILVGDGEKPAGGGWVGGEPGKGSFTAYVTVATQPAPPAPREPQRLSGQHSAWALSYLLRHFGATRTQADWCADLVRACVVGFSTAALPPEFGWTVESVVYPALGAVTRNDMSSPPYWSVAEEVQLRVTRERS